jgi:tripartite-type tricarboxylate transporter receptor subunit TctC
LIVMHRRALLANLALPATARAEAWPARPITLVVPFVPGGLPDANGRFMAQRIGALLGQPMVVENRPGAAGNIGAGTVAKAPPDGYTALIGTMGTHGSNPALYRTIGYDAQRDFTPIHGLFADNNIAVTGADSPFRSLADVAGAARSKPGQLTYSSGGIGSGVHLAGALFEKASGAQLLHVPYRGTPAALADVVAGRIDLIFDYAVTSTPLIKDGKLRPLAVTGKQRIALLPETPTVAEAGFPDAYLDVWSGLFLPAGVPTDVASRLTEATAMALGSEAAAAWAARTDSRRLQELAGPAFGIFVAGELVRWKSIVEFAGAKVE